MKCTVLHLSHAIPMHTGMADYRTLDRPICGDEFPASTGSERLHGTDATRLLFPWAEKAIHLDQDRD